MDQKLRVCSSRFRSWASVNCVEFPVLNFRSNKLFSFGFLLSPTSFKNSFAIWTWPGHSWSETNTIWGTARATWLLGCFIQVKGTLAWPSKLGMADCWWFFSTDACAHVFKANVMLGKPHALNWSLLQLLLVQFALGSMLWRGQGATWHRVRPIWFTGLGWVFWRATAGWQSNQHFLEHAVGNTFPNFMCSCTWMKICCSQSSTADTHIVSKMRTTWDS